MNASILTDLHTATTCTSLLLAVLSWISFSVCTYLHVWLKTLAAQATMPKSPVKSVA